MAENHFCSDLSPYHIDQYTFFFCSKWPPAAISEVRFRPFWMTVVVVKGGGGAIDTLLSL